MSINLTDNYFCLDRVNLYMVLFSCVMSCGLELGCCCAVVLWVMVLVSAVVSWELSGPTTAPPQWISSGWGLRAESPSGPALKSDDQKLKTRFETLKHAADNRIEQFLPSTYYKSTFLLRTKVYCLGKIAQYNITQLLLYPRLRILAKFACPASCFLVSWGFILDS